MGSVGGGGAVYGEGNAFARLVEEGLRPPRRGIRVPSWSCEEFNLTGGMMVVTVVAWWWEYTNIETPVFS